MIVLTFRSRDRIFPRRYGGQLGPGRIAGRTAAGREFVTTNRNGRILCALAVSLLTEVRAPAAAIDFFWFSTVSSEPSEVSAAFAGGFEAGRVTFDDQPLGASVARMNSPVARFRFVPATVPNAIDTSIFGTDPTSPPHGLAILPTQDTASVEIHPLGPTGSISLALLDLDVPVQLTATLLGGQTATWLLPDYAITDTLWVGVVATGNDLRSLALTPSSLDGYGIDDVEVRRFVPEPATGSLLLLLCASILARRRSPFVPAASASRSITPGPGSLPWSRCVWCRRRCARAGRPGRRRGRCTPR